MAITFEDLETEIARVGGLDTDGTDDATSAEAWAKAGLRKLARAGAWPWLRYAWTYTFVALDYDIAISSLASDLWRIDTRSLRYGGKGTHLAWGTPESIDGRVGFDWRENTIGGTPLYATRMGVELWIAPKPSATFVASNPTLYGYGWRSEPSTGTLYLPEEFLEVAVDAGLSFGWAEEDDPRAVEKERMFRQVHLPEMMSLHMDVGDLDRMFGPSWSYNAYESIDDYGDAQYS